MFRGVGNDGNDDEGNPFLIDSRVFNKTIDTVDEVFGGEVGDNRDSGQKKQGRRSVHAGVFDAVQGGSGCVSLNG